MCLTPLISRKNKKEYAGELSSHLKLLERQRSDLSPIAPSLDLEEVNLEENSFEFQRKESYYREPKKFGQEISTQKSVKLAQGKEASCQCAIF